MRHGNRDKIVQIYEEMDRKIRSGSILLSVPKGYARGQAIVSPWSQHHNPPTSAEPLWFLVIYYPSYSTFSPVAMESRRVTIVQYNLTSSKDEKDSDQTYVYSSSKLLHSVLQNSCLNRQQRRIKATTVNRTASWPWSQTAQATRQVLLRLQVKQKRLSGNASRDLEIIANNTATAAPIYVASSSESEEQDNEFSRLPLLSDGA